jgi:serine/threonine protein kinase
LGGNNQGGYGVVRKVQIKRFVCISSTSELVGKTPKMDDKWKTCKQHLVEALACLCEHPSVKFLAIHTKTMEAYILWWNGGTLQEMLDYNMKYSPIMDTQTLLEQRGPNMEGKTQLATFRRNCVKLAWAFINIMNAIHHSGILHNDLFKDNITLHFFLDKPNVVYIVVGDWGEVGCLQKVTPSLYGFAKKQDATNTRKMCRWVAL